MELQTAHLLAVSDFWYLQNSASCIEIIVIFDQKTRFLGYCLLRLEDIKNRRRPKDAPRWAAYFTYQILNSLIHICGLMVMVHVKNRRFLNWVRPLPRRPIKPAGSKTGTVANTRYSYNLNHTCFRSLLSGDYILFCPLLAMPITIIIRECLWAENIMMFILALCAIKCLDWPWRFAVMGSNRWFR